MTTSLARRLAFAPEVTSGTPPADATAWLSAYQIFVLMESLDPSVFAPATIDDERQQTSVLAYARQIKAIQGGIAFPFTMYMTGNEMTSRADADTVTLSATGRMLEHCWGGRRTATSHLAAAAGAHTTTAVELDSVAGLQVNDWLGFPDADGNLHKRMITNIASNVCTLHQALDAAPQDGQLIVGLEYYYPLESRLVNSNGAGGPFTYSYLPEVGYEGATVPHVARGCATYITGMTFERNMPAKLEFNTLVASYLTPDQSPSPAWTDPPEGEAGRVMGVDTRFFMADAGTATVANHYFDCASFTVDPGVVKQAIPTITERTSGMPGISHYSLARNPAVLTASVTPLDNSIYTDFYANTDKHVHLELIGPPGVGWSIYAPRVEITSANFTPVDIARGQNIPMRCLNPTSGYRLVYVRG